MSQPSYALPATIDEALTLAKGCGEDYVYYGGGTDIQVYRKQGLVQTNHIIDISAVKELSEIVITDEILEIGSMVTLDEITRSKPVRHMFPLIIEAAKSVATPVIRKTATIGGNILVKNRCHFYNQSVEWRSAMGSCLRESGDRCQVTGQASGCFSRNVSDLAPALIALDGQVDIRGQDKTETIPLIDLYAADGLKPHRHLEDDGMITRIRIHLKPDNWWYRKLRLRRSIDFSSLTVAGTVDHDQIIRVCLNGVSMAPALIQSALNDLTLEALQRQARKTCQTVDNDYMPLKYRRRMMDIYLEDCWNAFQAI